MGLSGTCEVQILRSATTWSLGTENTEHSIQSAYIKMIDNSDHFVYMENQFFITSTETLNNKIVNGIGDALVRRIIRAHENDEDWRAVIVIPLMPGFQNEVNEAKADPAAKEIAGALEKANGELQTATMWLMQNAMQNPNNAGAASYSYMHLMGIVTLGLMWLRMTKASGAVLAQVPKPPKITVCTAPSRAHASIATTTSGTMPM